MASSAVVAPAQMTFLRVLAAEWLKLRRQRSFKWITGAALVLALAVTALAASLLGDELSRSVAEALRLAASMPTSSIGVVSGLFGLGLCVWLAGEFASGSNYLTLLAVPRRSVIFAARVVLVLVLSWLFYGVVALIATAATLRVIGPDQMVQVVSQSGYWMSVSVGLLVCSSTVLMYFSAAMIMRRSLPAVGAIAVLVIVLPGVADVVSFFGGPQSPAQVLGYSPGPLLSSALQAASGELTTIPLLAIAALLALWSALFVALSGWSFARFE